MKYLFSCLAIIAFFSISFFATAQKGKINFIEYDLENGLHVILHQDKSTPIVAISMLYHVGSKNENPERTGFAHFFEHLLFEGSENIKRGEFDKYVENAGGTLNAFTNYDQTYYHEVLPSHQLALGLWLESERLMHARIDKKGIETQREVVKEERRQRIDNTPYGTVLEQIMKRAYQQHPYKWPVIGYMEHIDAATEQDFIDFYKTFYVPNNAILTIAGDIDIPTTKALINQYFADIPRGKTPINRNVGTEPPLQAQVKDVVQDNIRLPAVILAYRTPERNSPDYYVVDLLSQLLSQGKSSRLSKALVDEQQLSLYVGAFPMGLEQPSITVMYAIANVGTTAETLEEALYAQIERVKNELITDKELQKLKNQVENNLVNAKSSVADIARELAHHYMYTGNTHLINTEIEKYLSITAQDLQKAAQKYFNKQNSVVLYYLPKNQ